MTAAAALTDPRGHSQQSAGTGSVGLGSRGEPHGAENFGEVLVLPVPGEPARFHYLPLGAGLQKNPDGSLQAQVIAAGSAGFLQMTTIWDVASDALEDVRETLAGRLDEDPPAPVILSFAPVSDVTARLLIRSGGEMRVLADRDVRGGPPFTSLFNISLDQDALAAAVAAMDGQAGNLEVHYHATLNLPVVHRARVSGDLSRVTDADSLDRAIEEGRARVEMPDRSAEFRTALLNRATEILRADRFTSGADMVLDVEFTANTQFSIQAGTDVASWFGTGDAPRVVRPGPRLPDNPVGDTDPRQGAVNLRLAEPGTLADVVAFVSVSSGDRSVQLTPDDPVVTASISDAGQPLDVATHYLRGGVPFHTQLTIDDIPDVELGTDALGIEIIRVTAAPLEAAGYDRVRVTLRYRPEDRAARDTETLRFHDTPFKTRSWPIVTRGIPLDNSLTYEFRAESLDRGLASLRVPETVATSPDITLAPGPANEE